MGNNGQEPQACLACLLFFLRAFLYCPGPCFGLQGHMQQTVGSRGFGSRLEIKHIRVHAHVQIHMCLTAVNSQVGQDHICLEARAAGL